MTDGGDGGVCGHGRERASPTQTEVTRGIMDGTHPSGGLDIVILCVISDRALITNAPTTTIHQHLQTVNCTVHHCPEPRSSVFTGGRIPRAVTTNGRGVTFNDTSTNLYYTLTKGSSAPED
jgi:hypothetical protein